MSDKKAIQGIGGVFLYARDAAGLAAWYEKHLGLTLNKWGSCFGMEWPSKDVDETGRQSSTVFSIFQHETPDKLSTETEGKTARLNLRVSDLDALLASLKEGGVEIEDKEEDSDFGRFRWIHDPENNRLELWEPPVTE